MNVPRAWKRGSQYLVSVGEGERGLEMAGDGDCYQNVVVFEPPNCTLKNDCNMHGGTQLSQ